MVTRQYQATPVQLSEVLKVCQGCRILNLTAKQPVVLSPAVQFRPVPLTKMKPLRVAQVKTRQAVTLQWTRPSCPQSSVAHTYKGGPRGNKDNETSHINDGSSPLNVFLLCFAEIITLLVVETNRYYQNCIDGLDDGPCPEPNVTEAEVFVFLALRI